MGVLFIENLGGEIEISCRRCRIYLTRDDYAVAEEYVSSSLGPCIVYTKVVNYSKGGSGQSTQNGKTYLTTIIHCKRCNTYIGWRFEQCIDKDEHEDDLEGFFALERTKYFAQGEVERTSSDDEED